METALISKSRYFAKYLNKTKASHETTYQMSKEAYDALTLHKGKRVMNKFALIAYLNATVRPIKEITKISIKN